MNNTIKKAKYITEWDDGETIITSNCKIDVLNHTIIQISSKRKIESPIANDLIDDTIEILDSQYILFPDGTTFPVINKNDTWTFSEYEQIPFVF